MTAPAESSYRRDAALVAVSRMAPLAVQLAATPFVLSHVGADAYAAWALMMTTINLLLTADLGVVGIMQRYHGVARGRNDTLLAGRVTGSVLLVLGVLLVLVTAAGPLIADVVLAVVDLPAAVQADAWLLFRNAGTLAILQLLALAFSSYLAAHSRFAAMAVQSLLARLVLVAGILVALLGGHGLPGLLLASYADAAVAVVLGAWLCRHHLVREVRRATDRAQSRDLWAYAWRNQASALGFVAQRELDVILAGIMLPTVALASVAATAPLTAAVCLAPSVLLTPLFTRLSVQAGTDPEGLPAAAAEAETVWLRLVLPFGALVLGVLPFAAAVWLGPELVDVTSLTALLAAGFLLTLAGNVRAIVVRAAGKPGIETRSYVAYTVLKVGVGVLLAATAGMLGLAASGIVAALVALLVLRSGSKALIHGDRARALPVRTWAVSAALLVLSAAASWGITAWLDNRFLTLLALVLVALAGLAVARLAAGRGTGATSVAG